MKRLRVSEFDLKKTIESGQLFRYESLDGRYLIHTAGGSFCVAQQGDTLAYQGISREKLVRFFRLDEELSPALARLSRQSRLQPVLKACRGLRLVRQDPWECLVSFVCSSCCNIPRIRKMLDRLCSRYGSASECGSPVCRDRCAFPRRGRLGVKRFPRPGTLGGRKELQALRLGFRAIYLAEISRRVEPDWLEGLRRLQYAEAREQLRSLPGVGEKVADCVLLFSLGFDGAFPIDVHVRRAMQRLYFDRRNVSDRAIQAFAREHFGRDAGLAQQYLFHYERTQRPR